MSHIPSFTGDNSSLEVLYVCLHLGHTSLDIILFTAVSLSISKNITLPSSYDNSFRMLS